MFKEMLLLFHPTIAVIIMLLIVWFIASLTCKEINDRRIKKISLLIALLMIIIWISAGYWYVQYYSSDKAMIIKSNWSFTHKFFMETKEHIFFIVLILSLYLPIVALKNDIAKNQIAKKLLITIGILLLSLMLYIEGAGAIIAQGAKMAYINQEVTK